MCENAVKKAFGGDGMAWRREQEDVLAHAKQLGYDRAGGSIISPTDNKQDWESWRNSFVNWKNKNVALEPEGKAFWQQGSGGGSSEASAPLARVEVGPSPIQEAAQRNVYFPMLVPEYSAPQALDYSAYTGMSPFGGQGGLLYQPGTQQYREAFPIADNILSYQPPQLGFPQVTYSNPIVLGLIEEGLSEGGGGGGSDKKKNAVEESGRHGGKGPGDIGYDSSNPPYGYANIGELVADMSDRISGGQGLTAGPGAGWGNAEAGAGIGVSGGSGKGPAAGGMGKGY